MPAYNRTGWDCLKFCGAFHEALVASRDEQAQAAVITDFSTRLLDRQEDVSITAYALQSAISSFGVQHQPDNEEWRAFENLAESGQPIADAARTSHRSQTRVKRALTLLVATWSLERTKYYGWENLSHDVLEKLVIIAKQLTWDQAKDRMNHVLAQRHTTALTSPKAVKIGERPCNKRDDQGMALFPLALEDLRKCMEARFVVDFDLVNAWVTMDVNTITKVLPMSRTYDKQLPYFRVKYDPYGLLVSNDDTTALPERHNHITQPRRGDGVVPVQRSTSVSSNIASSLSAACRDAHPGVVYASCGSDAGSVLPAYDSRTQSRIVSQNSVQTPLPEDDSSTNQAGAKEHSQDVIEPMHGCGHSSDLSLTIAESSALRRQGMFKESDDMLKRAIGKLSPDSNYKIYMLGNFNLSLAENAIMQNDYKLAEDRIMQADLSELVVDGEVTAQQRWGLFVGKYTAQGRLYRFTGNFEKAKVALEPCLRYFEHLPKDKIHYVVRQLADVLIELGNPEEAMALLQKHLSKLHAQGKMDTIAYNRLSLSFADAEILLGQHEAAQTRLEKVKHWFDLHSPANHTEQLDHVRALIAPMRIAVRDMEWEMVQEHSEKALHLASEYSSFSPNNYYKGYIYQARVASHAQIARMHLERAASDAETVGT